MRARDTSYLLTSAAFIGLSACDYTRDNVAPSCYGETTQAQAGRAAATGGASAASPSRPTTGPSTATPSGGAAGTAATDTDDEPATPAAGSSAPTAPTMMSGATNNPPTSSTGGADRCDLTGDWLFGMRKVTDGLGVLQYTHVYSYYKIEQQDDTFTVAKGLLCSTDVFGGGDFAITVTYSPATLASVAAHVKPEGRKGTSAASGNGCSIQFDRQYTVAGATLPYYLDPNNSLPTAEQPAMGSTPGWEDWDNDGHPGITGICEGTVAGEIYTAAREWGEMSGTVPDVTSVFKIPLKWDHEPNVMAFDGSPFLGATAVPAADPSGHLGQFARLKPDQVAGDDAAICKTIIQLGPMLTPDAAAN